MVVCAGPKLKSSGELQDAKQNHFPQKHLAGIPLGLRQKIIAEGIPLQSPEEIDEELRFLKICQRKLMNC